MRNPPVCVRIRDGLALYMSSLTGENTPQYPHKTLYGQDLFSTEVWHNNGYRRTHACCFVFPIIMTLKGNTCILISIYTFVFCKHILGRNHLQNEITKRIAKTSACMAKLSSRKHPAHTTWTRKQTVCYENLLH